MSWHSGQDSGIYFLLVWVSELSSEAHMLFWPRNVFSLFRSLFFVCSQAPNELRVADRRRRHLPRHRRMRAA